jgi:hypothetical protein
MAAQRIRCVPFGAALATTFVAACTGTIGGEGQVLGSSTAGQPGPSGGGATAAVACAPAGAVPNFHRLNAKQYEETVNALFSLN